MPQEPSKQAQSSDYFLHVDILVDEDDVKKYEATVEDAIRVLEDATGSLFQKKGVWQLRHALKSDKMIRYDSPESWEGVKTDPINAGLKPGTWYQRYVHVWDVLDPDIAAVMKRILPGPLLDRLLLRM